MAYIRKKGKPSGGRDYYQIVESRRVDGNPRQRVLMHLGTHATADDAIKRWPYEVGRLRRQGYEEAAKELRFKLDRLKEWRAAGIV